MTESIPKNSQGAAETDGQSPKKPLSDVSPGANRYVNGGFFMVAASLVGAFIYLKGGPQSAMASVASSPAFDSQLSQELAAIKKFDQALSDGARLADDFKFLPAKVQVPLTELKVNPFHQGGAEASPADSRDDPTTADLREKERLAALQALKSLRLQSILRGPTPRTCMINSTRYQEGQEADGFLIEEIASNTVVVRKGVYRFELKPSM
jgi:hypothetical protein